MRIKFSSKIRRE